MFIPLDDRAVCRLVRDYSARNWRTFKGCLLTVAKNFPRCRSIFGEGELGKTAVFDSKNFGKNQEGSDEPHWLCAIDVGDKEIYED